MRDKPARSSSLAPALGALLSGWVAYALLSQPRPQPAPRRRELRPAPPAPRPTAPPAEKPLLHLQQRVQVECAGIIYEGMIQSIYIEDGVARLTLVDHLPDPVKPELWTWDDEGQSLGN